MEDSIMPSKKFFSGLYEVLDKIGESQDAAIENVATWAAEAIAADRFAILFGTGHSFLVTADAFPRIGAYPGWLPLHELSTSYIVSLLGNQGIRQMLYLENLEGFAHIVLQNYRLDAKDLMIVISHSGVHSMGIDYALIAKEQGLKTVAITSTAQSKSSKVRHSSGKRLYEVCDVVIDTCVPVGDALVEIPGFSYKVASASTIAACAIMQALMAETAQKLASKGVTLPQISHDKEMLTASIAEHARRVAGIYK
jgi:uncharacterized phosphosugar-binding protein